ncbi:uncharacterized protein LOC129762603 [Toxorhynchites rutilus septentrionalis]|uniref:uncharacterized protein LOC129762603 n=1 Tax=Toxorhynchites rutilus septentrionalis TaxID=329112 RepID=UPI0024789237|nr:uncharacterized protein LOC129762603 [Toxorhynchites rutilus septentrionalis]
MKFRCQENPNFQDDRTLEIWKICERLRSSLDPSEIIDLRNSFQGFDRCSSGFIQGHEFARILNCCLRKPLCCDVICRLAEYFSTPDFGGVAYGQFLDIITKEDESCDAKQEKYSLSSAEHRRLALVLMSIAKTLRFREQILRPYFEEYERIAGNVGCVTYAYFKRVLYFLGVTLGRSEWELLAKRFMVHHCKLDYEAFVEEIDQLLRYLDTQGPVKREEDEEVPLKVIIAELPKVDRSEVGIVNLEDVFEKTTTCHPCVSQAREDRSFHILMDHIQKHVWKNRIRIREFFDQYDLLCCGWLSRTQFIRSMDAMGLSGLYKFPMTDCEIKLVCDHYKDPRNANRIQWVCFTDDVDRVFAEKDVAKGVCQPCDGEHVSDDVPVEKKVCAHKERDLAAEVIQLIRTLVSSRRILIEPVFRDFDPHCNGHITRGQVGEALAMVGISITEEQKYALDKRFSDDFGFNYTRFLKEVDPSPCVPSAYETIQRKAAAHNRKVEATSHHHETDIVRILAKIKGQVIRKKVRIVDFMRGFDSLNHARITRDQFERGLATAKIELTSTEVRTVADMFRTPLQDTVDYRKFCDTIAEIDYQCNLEKAPLLVPLQHFTSEDGPHNHLNFEERTIVSRTLQKLARYADVVSNLSSPLKDFDRNQLGIVNKNQLIRALAMRDLHTAISSREFEVLCKCFGVNIGCRREINYRALLAALDYLYANRHNHPF